MAYLQSSKKAWMDKINKYWHDFFLHADVGTVQKKYWYCTKLTSFDWQYKYDVVTLFC